MKVQKQYTSNDDDDERQRSTRRGNFRMRICFWKVMELGVDFLSCWDVKIFIKYFLFFSPSSRGKIIFIFLFLCFCCAIFASCPISCSSSSSNEKDLLSSLFFILKTISDLLQCVCRHQTKSSLCFYDFSCSYFLSFLFSFYFHRAAYVVSLLPYFMIH